MSEKFENNKMHEQNEIQNVIVFEQADKNSGTYPRYKGSLSAEEMRSRILEYVDGLIKITSEHEDWMDDWKKNRQGVLNSVHSHLGNARHLYSNQEYEKMRLEDERHDLALAAVQAEEALHTEDRDRLASIAINVFSCSSIKGSPLDNASKLLS